jgi:hypothetical protein
MADKDDKIPDVSQEDLAMLQSFRARHPMLYQITRLLNSQDRLYRLHKNDGPENVIEDEMQIREEILNDLVKSFPKQQSSTGVTFVLEDVIDMLQDELDQPDPSARLS